MGAPAEDCRSGGSVSQVEWDEQGNWSWATESTTASGPASQAGQQEQAAGWTGAVYEDLFTEEHGWIFAVDELTGEKLAVGQKIDAIDMREGQDGCLLRRSIRNQ